MILLLRRISGNSDPVTCVGVTVAETANGPQEGIAESELRDALVPGQMPRALRGMNLFWINIKQFLQSRDSDLPAENYIQHWQAVYLSFLAEDASLLRCLSSVTT